MLVTGGRDYKNDFFVSMALSEVNEVLTGKAVTLIVGDATGVDTFARKAALEFRWNVEVFKADWDEHGKAAGPIRNGRMINEGQPDIVLAFPGGRGTANCVKQAEEAGVPVYHLSNDEQLVWLLTDLVEGWV